MREKKSNGHIIEATEKLTLTAVELFSPSRGGSSGCWLRACAGVETAWACRLLGETVQFVESSCVEAISFGAIWFDCAERPRFGAI